MKTQDLLVEEDFSMFRYVKFLIAQDGIVVVDAVFQLIVVSAQVSIDEAHRTTVNAESQAYCPLISLQV